MTKYQDGAITEQFDQHSRQNAGQTDIDSGPASRGLRSFGCAMSSEAGAPDLGETGTHVQRERNREFAPHTLCPEQYVMDMMEDPPTFSLGISNLKERPAQVVQGPEEGDESGENLVYFSTGNPSVQQFEGHLRLCINSPEAESKAHQRGRQLCVLAVPRYMSIADFYRFLGEHMDSVMHMRIVHSDTPERYMALIDLDSDDR